MKTVGVAIIVLGIIMTVFTGFNMFKQKTIIEVGQIEISEERRMPVYWSSTGSLLIVAGIFLFVVGDKKSLT
jgi:hypothetical protein